MTLEINGKYVPVFGTSGEARKYVASNRGKWTRDVTVLTVTPPYENVHAAVFEDELFTNREWKQISDALHSLDGSR